MEADKELSLRMDRHQTYVTRQWQYFAAFLLLQGFLINAAKDLLKANPSVFGGLTLAAIVTTVVFYHLIVWAKVRIYRNAKAINELAGKEFIEFAPTSKGQGITFWLSLSMLSFVTCWLVFLYSVSGWFFVVAGAGAVAFLLWLSAHSANSMRSK